MCMLPNPNCASFGICGCFVVVVVAAAVFLWVSAYSLVYCPSFMVDTFRVKAKPREKKKLFRQWFVVLRFTSYCVDDFGSQRPQTIIVLSVIFSLHYVGVVGVCIYIYWRCVREQFVWHVCLLWWYDVMLYYLYAWVCVCCHCEPHYAS